MTSPRENVEKDSDHERQYRFGNTHVCILPPLRPALARATTTSSPVLAIRHGHLSSSTTSSTSLRHVTGERDIRLSRSSDEVDMDDDLMFSTKDLPLPKRPSEHSTSDVFSSGNSLRAPSSDQTTISRTDNGSWLSNNEGSSSNSLLSPKSVPAPRRISESFLSGNPFIDFSLTSPPRPRKFIESSSYTVNLPIRELRESGRHSLLDGKDSTLSSNSEKNMYHDLRSSFSEAQEFLSMKPIILRPGERTRSTTMRLEGQGFKTSRSGGTDFPVKSITRGTDSWYALLKPFVADIVFRSIEYRRFQSEVTYRPYTCHAAVLFVDLSNYSKITAALATKGAHAISSAVNAYLERLLSIIDSFGGDICKFAGDAVLCVWEGEENDLFINVLTAALCAMELQEKAGSHSVDGTAAKFRIHCGLSCGILESEIFAAPTHVNMQRLYHSVGGESLQEISKLVDTAKAGELCVSLNCVEYLTVLGEFADVVGFSGGKILKRLHLKTIHETMISEHINRIANDRMFRRNKNIEEEFIHPNVLKFLSHGGLSPTQIAQIRHLCVLFIAMTSNGSCVNWLMEVQSILDSHRCPIVQIIDDDKGVHVVAAINLYESDPDASLIGLDICQTLENKQVGCAIGMAMGSTFCGVTGSSSVACRWDITGPPAVRAARLMQYALAQNLEVAVDESLFDDDLAATRMKVFREDVRLKGTAKNIVVYTISNSRLHSAFRVLETSHGRVHNSLVETVVKYIRNSRSRCAVLVTGIPLSGKKIICQRAAGLAGLVPYLHVSSKCAGFLQLAKTVATWFQYALNDDVKNLALSVLENIEKNNWSRAHDDCVHLVNAALVENLQACFLVDRVQFLDEFSLSLIRECLQPKSSYRRGASCGGHCPIYGRNYWEQEDTDLPYISSAGKVCFLCVHGALYNEKSACSIVEDLTRSNKSISVPIVNVGEATQEELQIMFTDSTDLKIEDRFVSALAESAGYCAGYFMERVAAINRYSENALKDEKITLLEKTEDFSLQIAPRFFRQSKKMPVNTIRSELAMRFYLIFDELPPLFQTFLKVLSVANRTGFFKLPRSVMWEVVNDLIASGVESGTFSIVICEMKDMSVLKIDFENDEEVISFQSPALADIAFDVSTPIQVESIARALVERLEPRLFDDFRVPLVMSDLNGQLDRTTQLAIFWRQGYTALLSESSRSSWSINELDKWKVVIREEIQAAGLPVSDVLGDDFYVRVATKPLISERLWKLKVYSPPLAYGPLSHTIAVICRNTCLEFSSLRRCCDAKDPKNIDDLQSAVTRYLRQVIVIETFLKEYEMNSDPEYLEKERRLLDDIFLPAVTSVDAEKKALLLLDEFIPKFVEARVNCLLGAVQELREQRFPLFFQKADPAIRRAYKALRERKNLEDAAQDALMVLAIMNWRPEQLPEDLPFLYYNTVARITKSLKRRGINAIRTFQRPQTIGDLETFLTVTALLTDQVEKRDIKNR